MYVLSMDFGTSSLKTAVVNKDYRIIESIKEDYEYNIPNNSWVEIKTDDIIKAILNTLKKLEINLNKIDGVCYDTFSPSLVMMDDEGNSVYPIITHLDRRSYEESEYLKEVIGLDNFHSITGVLPFAGGTSITGLLWMKKNLSSIYNNTKKIGHLNTFIHKFLTGLWGIEEVNASMSGMYNTIQRNGWAKEILKEVDINPSLFPDILTPGEIYGSINNTILIKMGLRKGTPVSMGTNDIASAQVGANNKKNGDILIVSGSSEMISVLTSKPVKNKSYYLRCSANKDLWQVFAITAAGFALEWLRKEFYKDSDIDYFYSNDIKHALMLNDNSVVYQPYISGDRQSLEIKKASFEGIDLKTSKGNILAAMIKGIHAPILDTMAIIGESINLNKIIKCTGGLAKNNAIVEYKRKLLKEYSIEVIDDCPLIGNVRLFKN